MADVTYNTEAFPALLATLERIQPPLLLLAYKERDISERDLWDMIKQSKCSMELVQVSNVPGAGGAPVEIWAGVPGSSGNSADATSR